MVSLGQDSDIKFIRASEEERVEESESITIRVPPEILGYIFFQALIREETSHPWPGTHFGGFPPNSYNFLHVCRRWHEIASGTPQLWNFWGTTLEGWKRRRTSCYFPVDLVYCGDGGDSLDEELEDALEWRASEDRIRQIHLMSNHGSLLPFLIMCFLTPKGKGVQHRSIESIHLRHSWDDVLNVSNFFARVYLPKLRSLILHGRLEIPPWDCLAPRITLLETLSLGIYKSAHTRPPTMAQLFSILVSNPGLQYLSLSGSAIPEDDGEGSTPRVLLRQLKNLHLEGELFLILKLLDRLEFPDAFDELELVALDSAVGEVFRAAPQLREYFRRACKLQGILHVHLDFRKGLMIRVAAGSEPRLVHMRLMCVALAGVSLDLLSDLSSDLLSSLPQDRVRYQKTLF